MSQRSGRQAARRSALDAQRYCAKRRANRERRLERLAVAVLTALVVNVTPGSATRKGALVRRCRQ